MEPTPLAAAVRSGDPRALARAITLVENETPRGRALIGELYAESGAARVIGVTGPPGAGKSTLVDQLIRHLRQRRHAVGEQSLVPVGQVRYASTNRPFQNVSGVTVSTRDR